MMRRTVLLALVVTVHLDWFAMAFVLPGHNGGQPPQAGPFVCYPIYPQQRKSEALYTMSASPPEGEAQALYTMSASPPEGEDEADYTMSASEEQDQPATVETMSPKKKLIGGGRLLKGLKDVLFEGANAVMEILPFRRNESNIINPADTPVAVNQGAK